MLLLRTLKFAHVHPKKQLKASPTITIAERCSLVDAVVSYITILKEQDTLIDRKEELLPVLVRHFIL